MKSGGGESITRTVELNIWASYIKAIYCKLCWNSLYIYMGQFTRKCRFAYGSVSEKVAVNIKSYKNASRLNR